MFMQSNRLQRKLVPKSKPIAAIAMGFICLVVQAAGQELVSNDPQHQGSSVKANTIAIAEAQRLVAKSTIKMGLELDHVTQIDEELAKVLSKSKGLLSLSGLRTLNLQSAKALMNSESLALRLNGLVQISPDVAKVISQASYLELNALKPNLGVYQAFENRAGRLLLNGIEEIDLPAAKALTNARYPLDLNGLKSISIEVVDVLSNSEIQLALEGIKELSDEAQEMFSKRKETVVFQAISTITNSKFAWKIARQPLNINLPNIDQINPEILGILATSKQQLTLGLFSLNADQARSLESCTCKIVFPQITALDSNVIDILLESSARIELPSLEYLEDARFAQRLSRDASSVFRLKVDSLNEEIAAGITSKKKVLLLSNLQELEPGVARILAAHQGRLILSGLRSMSDQDAEWFSQRDEYLLLPESINISEQAKAKLKANQQISWRNR
jgi:hypothetical protein